MSMVTQISDLLDRFIDLSKKSVKSHPFIVVFLMHEYFRNIWPNDPFIEKKYSVNKMENTRKCLETCITILEQTQKIGSYFDIPNNLVIFFEKYQKNTISEDEETQNVYGSLWKELDEKYLIDETKNELSNIFEKNGRTLNELKGKTVLDMGCGSGRFTLALASLGASHVTGVDLGKTGLDLGTRIASELHLENIKFVRNSVLTLPFDDDYFDFVFCKGVLHHTGNLEKGLTELHRVLKTGGTSFLYLYGSGGIFWNSRKKMREVMKEIPLNYTMKILEMIGTPGKRYIFSDSWYVPIEEHVKRDFLENFLHSLHFSKVNRVDVTNTTGLNAMSDKTKLDREIWGDGELRYFLTK